MVIADRLCMAAEIRRCWSRITELQEANNREVEMRRKAEYQHLHINPLLDRLKNEFWSLERARLDYEHEKERLMKSPENCAATLKGPMPGFFGQCCLPPGHDGDHSLKVVGPPKDGI